MTNLHEDLRWGLEGGLDVQTDLMRNCVTIM